MNDNDDGDNNDDEGDSEKTNKPFRAADVASEIDDTIKQLKERIEIYQKPTEEEIAAFKVKAEKEFDEMHGLGEGEKKGQFREKRAEKHEEEAESPEQKDKYRGRKGEKKSKALNENDFPELD